MPHHYNTSTYKFKKYILILKKLKNIKPKSGKESFPSSGQGEFSGDDYGGEIIVVKGLRIANRILVGLLGGSRAKDCGGSKWWAVGFW